MTSTLSCCFLGAKCCPRSRQIHLITCKVKVFPVDGSRWRLVHRMALFVTVLMMRMAMHFHFGHFHLQR